MYKENHSSRKPRLRKHIFLKNKEIELESKKSDWKWLASTQNDFLGEGSLKIS